MNDLTGLNTPQCLVHFNLSYEEQRLQNHIMATCHTRPQPYTTFMYPEAMLYIQGMAALCPVPVHKDHKLTLLVMSLSSSGSQGIQSVQYTEACWVKSSKGKL